MAPASILKTSTGKASQSISFDPSGVTACRYFDLISDEMYARGRRMKITQHFKDVFGLLPTIKSKIREASKEEAVPFEIPPEPETIIPCEDPSNNLERQNANAFEMLYDPNVITAEKPVIILPASDFDPHSIKRCDLVLKGICEMNYTDIAALMSLNEESMNAPRPQKSMPENLEDRVAWRRLQNLVHLS